MFNSLCAIIDKEGCVQRLEEAQLGWSPPSAGVSIADGDWFDDPEPLPRTEPPLFYVHLSKAEGETIRTGLETGHRVEYHIVQGPFAGCFEPDNYLIVDGRPVS